MLLGLGVIIGGATIYTVVPDTDPDAVKNQALADGCVARAAEAEFKVTDEGVVFLNDAGIVVPTYARLQFPISLCIGKDLDGGNAVILPELPMKYLRRIRVEDANITPCASRPGVCPLWGNNRPFKLAPHACAWKPAGGAACTKLDGGDPGVQNTMQAGEWVGAGCVRKTCVIIAGDSEDP